MYLICNYKSLAGSENLLFRKELSLMQSSVILLTRKNLKFFGLSEVFVKTLMISMPIMKDYEAFVSFLKKKEISVLCCFDGSSLYPIVGNGGKHLLYKSKVTNIVSGLIFFVKILDLVRGPFIKLNKTHLTKN